MPTSARGSDRPRRRAAARGFTLIELLVVVALVAVASTVAALALRDPSETLLEREAARLSALLEAARAEARASGIAVRWVAFAPSEERKAGGFDFIGLPDRIDLPGHWLAEGVTAEVRTDRGRAAGAVLGPEPIIGAQRIVLRLESRQLAVATDGLGPFVVDALEASDAPP
ncbi:MAG TPA: prepilin-type N-terminal cleavage/methylation domain-containing protein [Methylibium sp.]|nr:prepilin-type N-terminal cleavage/methylation domain-containing protein [Methylibium sp.]